MVVVDGLSGNGSLTLQRECQECAGRRIVSAVSLGHNVEIEAVQGVIEPAFEPGGRRNFPRREAASTAFTAAFFSGWQNLQGGWAVKWIDCYQCL
jgi:hypothetical protein